MLEEKLEQDIKTALLAGDSERAGILKFLKAALLNVKVARNTRDTQMSDEDVIAIFQKEAKKRQESADFFIKGGSKDRAESELKEKKIIEGYLPEQLSEDEVTSIIDKVIKDTGAESIRDMGKVIGRVKEETGASADGAMVARIVKEKLS
jgi:uncharacterized protein YqeY